MEKKRLNFYKTYKSTEPCNGFLSPLIFNLIWPMNSLEYNISKQRRRESSRAKKNYKARER